jgi:hypothetical protein
MALFRPNTDCVIVLPGERDGYGQMQPGSRVKERCFLARVQRRSEKSTVRADSSASRGAAQENLITGQVLLAATTRAVIGAIVEAHNLKLKIVGMGERANLRGQLDHYVADVAWSAQE